MNRITQDAFVAALVLVFAGVQFAAHMPPPPDGPNTDPDRVTLTMLRTDARAAYLLIDNDILSGAALVAPKDGIPADSAAARLERALDALCID